MNRQGSKQALDATVGQREERSPASSQKSDEPLGDVLPLHQKVAPKPRSKPRAKRQRPAKTGDEATLLRERMLEMERKLQQLQSSNLKLQSELDVREQQVRDYKTHRAFEFAQELVDMKDEPSRAWRLPLAMARLAMPKPARRWLQQNVLQPVRKVGDRVVEVAVEEPLRRLPDPQPLVDKASSLYRQVEQGVFGKLRPGSLQGDRWPAEQPLVSVIIPCFNYGRFLSDALVSLDKQTLQDFEIIIVEGGSTDGTTTQLVRELEHPKVRKIFQPEPTLVGENRLTGLQQARGKYITFLDADDMI
ncbi:glycosyltransferase, partial [Archangium sp.]|uniref:glycosyltransferase family 2 protein n=1 Tax=Archangium sp. TaxID=1872627 RepID=UPI002EDB3E67